MYVAIFRAKEYGHTRPPTLGVWDKNNKDRVSCVRTIGVMQSVGPTAVRLVGHLFNNASATRHVDRPNRIQFLDAIFPFSAFSPSVTVNTKGSCLTMPSWKFEQRLGKAHTPWAEGVERAIITPGFRTRKR